MTEERKKAFEIFRKFESIGMEWEKARMCSIIYISGIIETEKKYANFGEYEFLKRVKTEIESI
jgi:hypothetical protein